jgi:nucleotide-binding universal stress UspA family protein
MESEAVMPVITTLASNLQMEISLLRVLPRMNHSLSEVETYLQDWCERLAEKGITSKYEIRAGSPADHIIDLADESACDLVAMCTHNHNIGSLWPLGSVAQKVLLAGNSPLLLVRA